jgi:hypothetical protein
VAGVLRMNVQIPPMPGLSNAPSGPPTLLTMMVGGGAASTEINIQ